MKITIYELLGMVKDEPDRSIYVKYFDRVNKKEDVMWACKENIIYKLDQLVIELNDEVEILEEKPTQEEIKEYTNKFLEAWIPVKKIFGKLFDEIARIGNTLDLEDELEEEKKIPKKLEYYDDSIAWVIDDVGQLSDVDKVIIDKLNQVIDYLKSKGE